MNKTGVIVGLDIGEARTGIARSDALQMIAFPYGVVHAKMESEMAGEVATVLRELSPVLVVAGLPLNQEGKPGLQAIRIQSVIDQLRALIPFEIITQDERFTTAEANRVARDMKARSKTRKGKVDQIAATLILQTFLDRRAVRSNMQA
jgi:putative holliday junction resolvase